MASLDSSALAVELGNDTGKIGDAISSAIQKLDRGSQRRFDCIIGALVGDSASVASMWNYDHTKIAEHLQKNGLKTPEFCEPPSCTHFTVPVGFFSCHGDQIVAIMEAIVESGGIDTECIAKKLDATFDLESAYGSLENTSGQNRGWRNACVKTFVEARGKPTAERAHPTDTQADAFVRIIPVVALYAGRPELMQMVEKVVRVLQNNDDAVVMGMAAARILEGCILGKSPDLAVFESGPLIPASVGEERRNAYKAIVMDMYEMRGVKDPEAVCAHCGAGLEEGKKAMARSCMPPYCFQLPVQSIASSPDSYSRAIWRSIHLGGDCCSRSALLGAAAGACMVGGGIGGDDGVPLGWIGKLARGRKILELAASVAMLASTLPTPNL